MKITFIKPNIGRKGHSLYIDEGRMEPLPLGVLAGLTPPDIEVILYDDRMESIPFDEPTDLAAITVETYTARRAYEISSEYRKRNVPVIMGGMHTTLIPEEVRLHCDSILTHDAETCWQQVINDLQKNRLKSVYKGFPGVPHPKFYPRRDIYKGKGYLPLSLIQFGRGCRFQCAYCATSVYFNSKQYIRDIDAVINEIEHQDKKIIFFVDDNIVSDREVAKELFKEIIPLKIKWVSQASIDMTEDKKLMQLMADSGCLGNVIGFESINPQNLELMNKSSNISANFDLYKQQLEILKNYGLQTWAALTLGHDYDDVDSIKRTCDFALENRFTFAAFNILMPYPNTPLYGSLKKQGRLLYGGKWWLHPNYRFNHATFKPKKMTPEQLTAACFKARSRFNSFGSILRRAFDSKAALSSLLRLVIHFKYNRLFQKETFKKQGMHLGFGDTKE